MKDPTDNPAQAAGKGLTCGEGLIASSAADTARSASSLAPEWVARHLQENPEVEELAPLSTAQERIYLHERIYQSTANILCNSIVLPESTDIQTLGAALQLTIAEQAALRTKIGVFNGVPTQVVHRPNRFPVSLMSAGAPARIVDLADYAREVVSIRFCLESEFLFKAEVVQTSDARRHLLIKVHHIIFDGTSFGILFSKLFKYYRTLWWGGACSVNRPTFTYADFAREMRGDYDRRASSAVYFNTRLRGAEPHLKLFAGNAALPARSSVHAASLWIPRHIVDLVSSAARQHGATFFMACLSCLAVVLYNYSSSTDLLVVTPLSGRTDEVTRDLIGLFVSSTIIRLRFEKDTTFSGLLQIAKAAALSAFSGGDFSIDQLLLETPDNQPLIGTNVALLLDDTPSQTVASPPGAQDASEQATSTDPIGLRNAFSPPETGYDLKVSISTNLRPDQALITFEGRTSFLAPEAVARMLSHFSIVLHTAPLLPATPVEALPLLTEPEHEERDRRWKAAFPSDQTSVSSSSEADNLVACFRRSVAAHGDRTAVRDEFDSLTYRDLDLLSDALALSLGHALDAKGHGSRNVGILCDQSIWPVVGILAVLKARGTYICLDARAEVSSIRATLVRADLQLLLYAPSVPRTIDIGTEYGSDLRYFDIPTDANGLTSNCQGSRGLRWKRGPSSIAYILFTSGTTGEPKGVAQTDKNVIFHNRSYVASISVNPSDRVLMLANYTFDASVMDLYAALLTGAELYVCDYRRNGYHSIMDHVRRSGVTIWHSTPSLLRAINTSRLEAQRSKGIRVVVFGGETAYWADVGLARRVFGSDIHVVNGYGPTESTITCQYHIPADAEIRQGPLPIGRPLPQRQIILLNERGSPSPLMGEIAIVSNYLPDGYFKNPVLSEKRFVKCEYDPFPAMYKSGDRGFWSYDGSIVFLGREGPERKIRGRFVRPGQFAERALEMAGVDQAAALIASSTDLEEFLCVFIAVSNADAGPVIGAVRKISIDDMTPDVVHQIDAIPLTANGKLNLRRLQEIAQEIISTQDVPEHGPADLDELLLGAWREALGNPAHPEDAGFFAEGGDSYKAVRLITNIADRTGVRISFEDLFDHSSPRAMASWLREKTTNLTVIGYEGGTA